MNAVGNIPADRVRARTRAGSPNRRKPNKAWHPLLVAIFAEQDRQRVTNTDLARRAGFAQSYITNIRNGFTRPSMATTIALAEVLGMEFVVRPKETQP